MMKESFAGYQLSGELLKALAMLNYNCPTKVQTQVIPAVLAYKDIVVKSQTGSGKTAAFAIPICHLIAWDENKPQALVVTPTRELAIQVKEDVFNIGRFKRIKVSAIYGRSSYLAQQKELKQKTHVVVGTPGRIIDHIQRGTFDTSNIKYLILDEADEMLSMGFIEQLEMIINNLPQDRVTVLLSATMPSDIKDLCDKYMKEPRYVEIEEQNKAIDRIYQERYDVSDTGKLELLRDITIIETPDSCIVFCNTKQMVDEVYEWLAELSYACEKLHGGMDQHVRLQVMSDFKHGYFRYLIATDVAARGIDIDNVTHVINFDLPHDAESYVHRIGRTGRIGKLGKAISLVTENDYKFLNDIHKYIGKEISLKERPDKALVEESQEKFIEKVSSRPELKATKSVLLNKEITKIHINAGKKTKLRPVDVVGTLCNINGMTAADIGVINILDVSTFVEILNNKGELVLQALQNTPVKGRLRKVKKVDI